MGVTFTPTTTGASNGLLSINDNATPGLQTVSLTGPSMLDTDGDGLHDWWEIAHGTNWKVADAYADPDHDGMLNLQEFLAGTDPQDPQSRLVLNAGLISPGSVSLQFLAASNHSYSIVYKNSLGDLSWSKFVDVPARETNWLSSVVDATDVTNRFYRLVTPMLP